MKRSGKSALAALWLSAAMAALAAEPATPPPTVTPSITLAPTGYITTGLGGTKQFTAKVTGLANPAVIWAVGNVPGGNSTLGTISPTGLYTAPATMPSSSQITIRAISQMTTAVQGVTWIYLLSPGPVITSVTPNPLPVGQFTVTITGTGFQTGATAYNGAVQLSTVSVTPTALKAGGYQGPGTSTTFYTRNLSSVASNVLVVPVSGSSPNPNPNPNPNPTPGAPVVSPATLTLALDATQQFTAKNTTSWSAAAGTLTSAGLYTAPAVMPASGIDTITATGPGGTGTAKVALVSNVPPVIQSLGTAPLPLGVFSTTILGTGFTAGSTAKLNGATLPVTAWTATQLSVAGFAGTPGTASITVANGPVVSQPYTVQVGVHNPLVSPAAARRFLEQAAFGPTPSEAAHVQTIGFQAWLTEQFSLPVITSFNGVGGQGAMPTWFLANAVTNQDQLRQRVAFALSQIFVTSLNKLIWNADMVPYQQMLLADAFTSYRQILGDVTLSAAMGQFLDMANNAKANPALGTVANENYAREILQLFSIGTKTLNPDGTAQSWPNGPIPTYFQSTITEFARVFTGWTYAPKIAGGQPVWNAYINSSGPMVPYTAMHDFGSKTLLNGYVAPSGISPQQDLQGALDNIAAHPNVAPFISKQLIQHLVKSNPSPAYVQRVAGQFTLSNGDLKTVISAILLDTEARANDEGGADQPTDGHLQEPALLLPGFIRAFGGTMTTANYYGYNMAALGQDLYTAPSVFNYYSPGYVIPASGGLLGPEFQIDNPNAAILRENLIGSFFNQYQNPVQSYGPGTTVDLSPLLPLAAVPATLVDALNLTLTHGTMPAAMKQIIVGAVTAEAGGSLRRVQTGIYLILSSSYYNVWH